MEKLARPPLYSGSTIFMFVLHGLITQDYGLMAKFTLFSMIRLPWGGGGGGKHKYLLGGYLKEPRWLFGIVSKQDHKILFKIRTKEQLTLSDISIVKEEVPVIQMAAILIKCYLTWALLIKSSYIRMSL